MPKPRWLEDRGISSDGACLRAERHPAYRWAEPGRGDCREGGKLGVAANGKAPSGLNHESESTDAASSDGPPRSRTKRSSVRGAKGVVHPRWNRNGSTGDRRNPLVLAEAAALKDDTSRVTGDCRARICEGLGVKFPGPTRLPASKPEKIDVNGTDLLCKDSREDGFGLRVD